MANNLKIYIVETPVKDFCGVGAAGVQFAYGKAEICEGWVLDWYREHGYKVTEKQNNTPGTQDDEQGNGSVNLSRLKKEELIAYCEENNIDLGEAKTKDEILEVIKNQVQE